MKSSYKVTLHQLGLQKSIGLGALEPLEPLEAPEALSGTESFGKSWTRRQKLRAMSHEPGARGQGTADSIQETGDSLTV